MPFLSIQFFWLGVFDLTKKHALNGHYWVSTRIHCAEIFMNHIQDCSKTSVIKLICRYKHSCQVFDWATSLNGKRGWSSCAPIVFKKRFSTHPEYGQVCIGNKTVWYLDCWILRDFNFHDQTVYSLSTVLMLIPMMNLLMPKHLILEGVDRRSKVWTEAQSTLVDHHAKDSDDQYRQR